MWVLGPQSTAYRQHTAQRTCYCRSVLSDIEKKTKKHDKQEGKQSTMLLTAHYLQANEHSEQSI